ncbi:DUF6352 family protein [Ramlibacter rhizophilus]|uniref:Uncharacterized protein n=1 Tax=Ramlibacter rhizophilus TaxID=1781167 RepID=A0A4Z0BIY6_9BURK|nr:DUF6352 family protein [Ramlibacter rhizophilus]TFY98094.1 hypothetical protein EZ242_16745 [Ramlibacter rhizophilus]
MAGYWPGCGWHLLEQDGEGRLRVGDEFLRFLLERPELAPVPQSGPGERALHARLVAQPRAAVSERELAAVEDEDARANVAVWLRFRERLLARPTLEASYLQIFRGQVDVPPLLVHQLTQILLRQALGDSATPFEARAAEMLFRVQKIAVQEDGQVMAADNETVERLAVAGGFGTLGELLRQGGAPLRTTDLDVLNPDVADDYWARSEAHDLVLPLHHGQPGLEALCRVMERWLAHLLGLSARVQVEREIDETQWVWHVGLDAQASAVLNALYQGQDVDEAQMRRMLCLFSLHLDEPTALRPEIAGRPIYLAMAMDESQKLRLKPQNLLMNLPLAQVS